MSITVDDDQFALAPEQDLVDLMDRIESAARSSPAFVDFAAGDGLVSILICPSTRVVVTVRPERAADAIDVEPFAVEPLDWEF